MAIIIPLFRNKVNLEHKILELRQLLPQEMVDELEQIWTDYKQRFPNALRGYDCTIQANISAHEEEKVKEGIRETMTEIQRDFGALSEKYLVAAINLVLVRNGMSTIEE